jgi:hypothetical protein
MGKQKRHYQNLRVSQLRWRKCRRLKKSLWRWARGRLLRCMVEVDGEKTGYEVRKEGMEGMLHFVASLNRGGVINI